MPADSIPLVAAVVAMFVVFMVVLGSVTVWSSRKR